MTDTATLISSRPIDDLMPLTEEQLRIIASYYERLINGESVMDEFVALTHQKAYPETDEFYHMLGQFADEYKNTTYVETALIETDYVPTITAAKLSVSNGKFNDHAEKSARTALAEIIEANERMAHLLNRESKGGTTVNPELVKKLEVQTNNVAKTLGILDILNRDKIEQAVTVEHLEDV